jgi:tRNA threonylcarbamoyladenosine biosynthesis protein TsaE
MGKGQYYAEDELAMLRFGAQLYTALNKEGVVFLRGDLGFGKTTLSRGVVQASGHKGAVKSPTYTLVEPYENDEGGVYHFDLYRLSDPEELEYLGIRDYFAKGMLSLIEWPDKGRGCLPIPDLEISLDLKGDGRLITFVGVTQLGIDAAKRLNVLLYN